MNPKHGDRAQRGQVLARLTIDNLTLDSPREMLEKTFAATTFPAWWLTVAEAMQMVWRQSGIKGLQEPQAAAGTAIEAWYRASFAGTDLPVPTRKKFEALLQRAYPGDLILSFPESYSDNDAIDTGLWSFEVFFKADSEPDPVVHKWVILGFPIDFCNVEEVDEGFVKRFEYNFMRFKVQGGVN